MSDNRKHPMSLLIELALYAAAGYYLSDAERLKLLKPRIFLAVSKVSKTVAATAGGIGILAENAYHSAIETVR